MRKIQGGGVRGDRRTCPWWQSLFSRKSILKFNMDAKKAKMKWVSVERWEVGQDQNDRCSIGIPNFWAENGFLCRDPISVGFGSWLEMIFPDAIILDRWLDFILLEGNCMEVRTMRRRNNGSVCAVTSLSFSRNYKPFTSISLFNSEGGLLFVCFVTSYMKLWSW